MRSLLVLVAFAALVSSGMNITYLTQLATIYQFDYHFQLLD